MNYPVWDLGALGGGFWIALVAVTHVFVSHFAVGGGLWLVLTEMKAAYPEMAVCPLFGLWEMDLATVEPAGAEYVCPMAEMVLLNPWMIRQAHRDGRKVFIWFGAVENPILMRIMLAFGADGLMVDDPPALAALLSP